MKMLREKILNHFYKLESNTHLSLRYLKDFKCFKSVKPYENHKHVYSLNVILSNYKAVEINSGWNEGHARCPCFLFGALSHHLANLLTKQTGEEDPPVRAGAGERSLWLSSGARRSDGAHTVSIVFCWTNKWRIIYIQSLQLLFNWLYSVFYFLQ